MSTTAATTTPATTTPATTASTTAGPSGNQAAATQASGAPVVGGASGASGATGATGPIAAAAVTTETRAKLELPSWIRDMNSALADAGGPITLLSYVWLIVFHMGAGLLSYRTYGSPGWAVLAFLFAVFYYPYYALMSNATPPAAPAPLIGGLLRSLTGGKSRRR